MTRAKLSVTILLLAFMLQASGVPVQYMSGTSLGIEYDGVMAGQIITRSTHSLFKANYFMLRYAPVPYLLVSTGIGGTKFSEYDSSGFRGTSGISTAGGINVYTPRLFNFLMVTAGTQFYLLNSSRYRSHRIAILADPGAGIRFLIGDAVDIEGGVKAHILDGQKNARRTAGSAPFANDNRFRGYLALTLHSFNGSGYTTLSLDMSQRASFDWSNGPYETSLSLQVGACIKPFRTDAVINEKESEIDGFRNYDTLKEEQSRMAKELRKKR